ncbi:Blp family class II bacteriocin [Rummeliibacillus suwonensis]|uniref:Blp family class II bacteriocin n=1 Tax=Rummeliibacillus suwonensis TaxID=1306154 RepID=UPI0028979EBD|nr:Blp family class II bacteriocin [Rummeliibacillus suwonensis]
MGEFTLNGFNDVTEFELFEISGGKKTAVGYASAIVGGAGVGALIGGFGGPIGAGVGTAVGGTIGGVLYHNGWW